MRPDKTSQVTRYRFWSISKAYSEEQLCSCTCLHRMRPDKTPQMRPDKIPQVTRYCEEFQMRPDKTPQDTGVSEQQCSCTCLHQMRPDKIPQDTGVSVRCILKNSSADVPVSTR
ncbi:hypothetical protein Bbelb_041460 [Branchiostoma belcheri]|nr:hypothetical protein Bbelb_041460 [Branchiostoma belcheri]